jgi:hypothetical protein
VLVADSDGAVVGDPCTSVVMRRREGRDVNVRKD